MAKSEGASPNKFTPGEWKIRVEGTMSGRGPEVYVGGGYYDDGSEFVVADCGCTESSKDGKRWEPLEDAATKHANAALIAASPELHHVAEEAFILAEALILGTTYELCPEVKEQLAKVGNLARAALARAREGAE